VPDEAYDILEDIGIRSGIRPFWVEPGSHLGDLMLQLSLDPDVILALDGIAQGNERH